MIQKNEGRHDMREFSDSDQAYTDYDSFYTGDDPHDYTDEIDATPITDENDYEEYSEPDDDQIRSARIKENEEITHRSAGLIDPDKRWLVGELRASVEEVTNVLRNQGIEVGKRLTSRQQAVLNLLTNTDLNNTEIAHVLAIAPPQVSKLEGRILEKIIDVTTEQELPSLSIPRPSGQLKNEGHDDSAGSILKQLALEAGLTIKDIAQATDQYPQTLTRALNGKTRLKRSTIEVVAGYLNLPDDIKAELIQLARQERHS